MKNEKYYGTGITGPKYLKLLKEVNEDNRILFIDFHKYNVSNLPKYDDIYSLYYINAKNDIKDAETSLTPLKRHNFSTDEDFEKYIDKCVQGNLKSTLQQYKISRNYLFQFLLDNEINSTKLTELNQKQIDNYICRLVNTTSDRVIERYLNSINNLLVFHQDSMMNEISLDINKIMKDVPMWEGFPWTIDEATKEHIQFYNYWLSNYGKNVFIEVNGVLSYLFFYIYTIIADFIKTKDITKLNNEFEKMYKNYGHYESIRAYLSSWWMDAYLWVGDDRKYLEYKIKNFLRTDNTLNSSISLDKIIDEVNTSNDIDLINESFFLVMKNTKSLTNYGLNNLEGMIESAKMYLTDFKVEKGMYIRDYFYNKFDIWNLSEKDYKELEEYIAGDNFKVYQDKNYKTKSEWFHILKANHEKISKYKRSEIKDLNKIIKNPEKYSYEKRNYFDDDKSYRDYLEEQVEYAKEKLFYMKYRKSYLFGGVPKDFLSDDCYIIKKEIPQILEEAFIEKESRIAKECENLLREERGIPKIGEGWISETILYKQVIEAFPDEKVIHHGRPPWLGKQHLDIYFPEKNIGIEYQGQQHNEPIEYFGGIEAFKKQQKRDNKKKMLCDKNNCSLIYVYPDYNFEDIKNEIETLLLSNN
ncbi:hypothetical protein EQM13_16260 [Acidilutibacter cellobiosedens]|uniref:Uncharacterized protein n=1 Tax=Acidilutibacter cellobiosedens TaxID=2507161 RepID=A0A410QGE3_9FIRM|nr:hypothetical protein [Acidilutibacter cellobiosedens]QAT63006.1 hypothetical protein EQM13_16260 [Acidilutibacter cellobiosedens]